MKKALLLVGLLVLSMSIFATSTRENVSPAVGRDDAADTSRPPIDVDIRQATSKPILLSQNAACRVPQACYDGCVASFTAATRGCQDKTPTSLCMSGPLKKEQGCMAGCQRHYCPNG